MLASAAASIASMLHVVFEVLPAPGGREPYLATAARLRPLMEASGGCLALERFQRDDGSGWILSMQRWSDAESLARWRRQADHGAAQASGRARLFADYRLRVATRLAWGGTREDAGEASTPAAGAEGGFWHATPAWEARADATSRAMAIVEWTGEAP